MTADRKPYTPDPDVYWAAQDADAIGPAIADRFRQYTERVSEDGRLEVWRTADRCYHGRNPDGGYANAHAIVFGGSSGEVAQIHVGHYRQLVGSQLTIATESRPAVEVSATANDPEAVSDTIVARQVLEYDLDEGGLEHDLHAAHERALVFSEGYLVQVWDHHAGELVGTREIGPEFVDTAERGIPGVEVGETVEAQTVDGEMVELPPPVEVPIREGEIRVSVRSPIDVARDLDRDETGDEPWYIVRDRVHRWELAARYPEDAERRQAIIDAPGVAADEWHLRKSRRGTARDSDYIHRLTLYHPPSDALPEGRIVEVVDETMLSDDPYPYDHMVVHADVPSAELDSAAGYGDSWDLLALSQALDATESGMLTVADAGALVRYGAPRGAKVDARMLTDGMSLTEYDREQPGDRGPELLDRAEVRTTDLGYAEHQRKNLEMLSGINATIRGAAESEVKSGADRALIATMAVRANSKHQRALAKLMRSVLNGRVALYRQFCGEERLIEIAGRDKSGHVATFSAQTFDRVRRVRVELGPADLRTTEGKIALADKMLEAYGEQVITPDRYMALRLTGRLDEIDNNAAEHRVNARRENDMCRDGKGAMLQAIVTDHHAVHIREHLRELNDPAIRFDPARLAQIVNLTNHITAHATMWASAPPEILAASGQDPAPSTLMGPPAGPMPAGGPPANDNGAPVPANDNGMTGPGLPQMPQVAGTGERFTPGATPPGAQP